MANLFFRTNVAPYRIDTYNALHEKLGCEFYFLYDRDYSQNHDMKKLYEQCKFNVNILKSISLFGKRNQKFCTNIWAILRKENPQIVIVPEFKILTVQILLFKFLFLKKFKVVSMCDDSWDMVANNHEWSFAHKMMRKIVTPFLDDLLLVDDRVVEWYRKKYGKGIWLPIIREEKNEIPTYERVLPMSKELHKEFNLVGKKVLLFVGRLDPVKNLDRLFDAIEKTKEDYVTVIVGSGEQEEVLKKKAACIDKPIIFAGRYEGDGVRAWYNVADVFILPSKMEAFGAVTNEALIAGCYSLISEVAGSSCLIDDKNGICFNPNEIEAISKAIDTAVAKVNPIHQINVKNNLMPFTFGETINKVINRLLD